MNYNLIVRKGAAYLALLVVVLYIITGYGITQNKIVSGLTFGLISKPVAFRIHSFLIYPLIVFLIMHLYFSCSLLNWFKRKKK